jgi:uncharacterized protein YndB with AHSA1/START domain
LFGCGDGLSAACALYSRLHITSGYLVTDTDITANATASEATTGTVTFHRVFKAPPERVYRAFLEPDALAKWLPPHGYVGRVLAMDATLGGHYRIQFTHLVTGHTHAWGGTFVELEPHSRIVHTDRFDDPHLPGEMRTTVSLRAVQEGNPGVIPTEACCLGWQDALQLLTLLVEPEFPG